MVGFQEIREPDGMIVDRTNLVVDKKGKKEEVILLAAPQRQCAIPEKD
jgi:hypothetical protein